VPESFAATVKLVMLGSQVPLTSQVAMRDPRLEHGVLDQRKVAPRVPQGEGQHAHQRAVAIVLLAARSRVDRRNAFAEGADRS